MKYHNLPMSYASSKNAMFNVGYDTITLEMVQKYNDKDVHNLQHIFRKRIRVCTQTSDRNQ